MPIEITWLNENEAIIFQRLMNPLSITDFYKSMQQTKTMLSDYIIVDARQVSDLPRGFLAEQPKLTAPLNTKDRVMVTIGASESYRIFVSSFLKVAGYAVIEFVDTIEEAESLIRKIQSERES